MKIITLILLAIASFVHAQDNHVAIECSVNIQDSIKGAQTSTLVFRNVSTDKRGLGGDRYFNSEEVLSSSVIYKSAGEVVIIAYTGHSDSGLADGERAKDVRFSFSTALIHLPDSKSLDVEVGRPMTGAQLFELAELMEAQGLDHTRLDFAVGMKPRRTPHPSSVDFKNVKAEISCQAIDL